MSNQTMDINVVKEEKEKVNANNAAVIDYQENFMPKVHRIGRITMVMAFILAFLPVVYFYFIAGYRESATSYINTAIAIGSIGIGMWLTEPLAYWPVLGSAGTYMGYLSGNVGGMRFPVALSVQSSMKADINTPRGQVVTIIAIGSSIFTNLLILIIIVLAGAKILEILPDPVLDAFKFVMPCLFGSMILLRFSANKGGLAAGAIANIPYMLPAIIMKLLISNNILGFGKFLTFGTALAVGSSVLVAYIMYRVRLSKSN